MSRSKPIEWHGMAEPELLQRLLDKIMEMPNGTTSTTGHLFRQTFGELLDHADGIDPFRFNEKLLKTAHKKGGIRMVPQILGSDGRPGASGLPWNTSEFVVATGVTMDKFEVLKGVVCRWLDEKGASVSGFVLRGCRSGWYHFTLPVQQVLFPWCAGYQASRGWEGYLAAYEIRIRREGKLAVYFRVVVENADEAFRRRMGEVSRVISPGYVILEAPQTVSLKKYYDVPYTLDLNVPEEQLVGELRRELDATLGKILADERSLRAMLDSFSIRNS